MSTSSKSVRISVQTPLGVTVVNKNPLDMTHPDAETFLALLKEKALSYLSLETEEGEVILRQDILNNSIITLHTIDE